ncbi:hypothetical protein TRVL_00358 [Trypanosoma vivax]|uniref:Uncharacterized protein n=1 Tax=Trypanosoma vivax (strain Y486) TaxID=1055687 RepID=G0UCS0_TRYVY|nr:hypothetical protein TRVL_00358 [Trypanosoma vivax]CCC53630.1 hypothetical protein TVY486_1111140 [Trypanosoma vivax Y486]
MVAAAKGVLGCGVDISYTDNKGGTTRGNGPASCVQRLLEEEKGVVYAIVTACVFLSPSSPCPPVAGGCGTLLHFQNIGTLPTRSLSIFKFMTFASQLFTLV